MNVFSGASKITEPEWQYVFSDEADAHIARGYWLRIRDELMGRDLLVAANLHAMKRLTVAYVMYDKASNEIAENGAVAKPRRGNERAIARVSPHFQVMRDLAIDCDRMEAELGLAPRRRASATKAETGKKSGPRAASAYLPQRALAGR